MMEFIKSDQGKDKLSFEGYVYVKQKIKQALQQVHCSQFLAGHPSQPPRKKYADSNARILAVISNYNERNGLDYYME